MGIRISVDISGPIARGEAPMIMHRYKVHTEEVIAERGVSMIRAYLPTQYMYLGHNGGDPIHNPIPPNAGALAASITDVAFDDMRLIRGDLVSYGAWIEGVDALNMVAWPGRVRRGLSPRFEGYHTFRIITQELRSVAGDIAEAELPRYLDELNA